MLRKLGSYRVRTVWRWPCASLPGARRGCVAPPRPPVDEDLLRYLSPLGWEHINLTGDCLCRNSAKIGAGKFRPLRPFAGA